MEEQQIKTGKVASMTWEQLEKIIKASKDKEDAIRIITEGFEEIKNKEVKE